MTRDTVGTYVPNPGEPGFGAYACPECDIPWGDESPDCPRQIWDRHIRTGTKKRQTVSNEQPIERAAADAVRGDTVERALALPDAPPLGVPQDGSVIQPYTPLPPTQLEQQIADLLQPYILDIRMWAEALFNVREFPEQESEDTTLAMLASILMAKSSEEALQAMQLNRAKQLCGDEPGGHSPLLVITGARPVKSEYEEGAACYVIVDAYRKVDGTSARFTTGARAVQAAILAHIANGWLPFEAILTIRAQKTRNGFYPLNLEAGG